MLEGLEGGFIGIKETVQLDGKRAGHGYIYRDARRRGGL
jgi:hypothetical protein